ncbi:MAG: reprolysin-like metallopeptidase [Cyanobacteria bacterium J06649_4]
MNHSLFFTRLKPAFSRTVFAACAIALSSCTDGAMPSTQTISYDGLGEIDIQPIQVCDDHGNHCARVNMFADITARILEQARLKVNFLPTNQLNASRFLSLNDSSNLSSSDYEFYELSRLGGPGDYGRHEDSTRTSGPINVWFVDEIESSSNSTQFGLGWVDANGVAISSETLDYNNGEGRLDTLAHEIGHNLGLRHTTLGAGTSDNLLTDGSIRLSPSSIDDVGPDGAGVSLLTDLQVKEILSSGFVTNIEGEEQNEADAIASADAIADVAFLAEAAADLPLTPIGAIPYASTQLSQFNSSAAASSVPEPTTYLGLVLAGLSLLGAQRKSQT